eukprot:CAMPEP_0182907830 /NCGR_PEP_ID=MMETSP0034_2-20130328/34786_1 /TAXON_ID=156128 /ORGANISM="Nephroselmis pyriformis, Strain CCMP717" /LENGTH=97 /DNA_ID=CAMNT_0025043879 /DNA_START=183 /DNA_END=473 /DNA_ORIENTATION=+
MLSWLAPPEATCLLSAIRPLETGLAGSPVMEDAPPAPRLDMPAPPATAMLIFDLDFPAPAPGRPDALAASTAPSIALPAAGRPLPPLPPPWLALRAA